MPKLDTCIYFKAKAIFGIAWQMSYALWRNQWEISGKLNCEFQTAGYLVFLKPHPVARCAGTAYWNVWIFNMALFSSWSQFVTGASARSEDFRKSQQIDTKTYVFQAPISISSNKNIWSIFQPIYLPHHKLYVRNFLPINKTVQHIFNRKTYIFNDTNYLLIFTTFVTFGVPYITCVTVVILVRFREIKEVWLFETKMLEFKRFDWWN